MPVNASYFDVIFYARACDSAYERVGPGYHRARHAGLRTEVGAPYDVVTVWTRPVLGYGRGAEILKKADFSLDNYFTRRIPWARSGQVS